MTYRELLPHPALRRHVDRFWTRTPDRESGRSSERRASSCILPDGCMDVLMDLPSGEARVVGTMTRAQSFEGTAQTCIAAVRFRPGGARAFSRTCAALVTDRVVSPDELDLRWLLSGVSPDQPPASAALQLQAALLARLDRAATDTAVQHATRRLLEERPPSIAELARALGSSRQHLARRFREHVGISPKVFERVARLQRAVYRLQRAPSEPLARAAAALGYCDQAHMSRDFRELAGITPSAARSAAGSIFPIPSLWLEA